ncbi:aminotransferase class I/II-fold pyridoxal phosphate-dependent enzyme [Streptomyces kanamyceticus]|uniref:histidinol-phosphate transaminase n=2 Tax=Streptomyces kanamyceticus TaxID=1967 RepID=A0A5J6GPM1_STRKN|nr:aminotransferase class I/II-fold pyridoxal phosphate-dependent enzyme [Streptomyces kanamyceticus]QEU96334.1 aminotransferase class I/II-fold pyridoxal phosphate-dependent enzyme [Streptomyces kanamyceticus]
MRRPIDIDALQQVLCAALGTDAPVCTPAQLGVDIAALTAADIAVADRPTLVGGAAPYAPTTPAPTPQALDALIERARSLGVSQLLVPHVRRTDDPGALRDAGFVPVTADSECVVRLTEDVDDLLRGRVGADRLRELRALHEAVSQDFTWERIRLSELSAHGWAREAFVALHRQAAERDGHGRTPYNADALDALAQGAPADRTELLVRRREEVADAQDAVVQVAILVRSHTGRGTYHLAGAVGLDDPGARRNLEDATLYRLCLDARSSGLAWVHLGSGDAERKRGLGADLFIPLDHWLRAPDLPPTVEEGDGSALSRFATGPVAAVPVPGPARFRRQPRFDTIDLSSNTNPFLGADALYPHLDTTELARTYLAAIAELPGHQGVDTLSPEHVLFSSGSVDGVMLLLAALASPGETVCVTPPTFPLYAHFARVLRLPVVDAPLRGDDLRELDVAAILAAEPRVTFLCDPNNPVGTRLDRAQVLDLVTRTRGIVVIDEAYAEFSDTPSYAGLVAAHDNLIVLRTLSKAWGLAGARCGIALARPGLIDALRRVQVPFGFTDASQRAARHRLTNREEALGSVRRIRAERDRMASALAEHPSVERVFPSETNFLLVRLHKHEQVMARFAAAGIVVADTGFVIPATCRISIGDPRANDTLLAALSSVL